MDQFMQLLSNILGATKPLVSPQASSGQNQNPQDDMVAKGWVKVGPNHYIWPSGSDPSTQTPQANPLPSASPNMEALAKYKAPILSAAKQYGIDPSILAGALARESGNFNDQYVYGYHTDKTGRGIAGIDKTYHPEVSDNQAFDPTFSINWMANKLADLKSQTGNMYDATRMYNGGGAYNSNNIGFDHKSTIAQLTKRHADAIQSLAQAYKPLLSGK